MIRRLPIWLVALALSATTALPSITSAQVDPESGDTGEAWQPPPGQTPPAQTPPPAEETPPAQTTQQTPPPQSPPPQQASTSWQAQPAAQPAAQAQPQQQQGWFNGQQQEAPPTAPAEAPADNDHAAVVGSVGFTFFGVDRIRIEPNGVRDDGSPMSLHMPTVGIRYWLSEMIGLDIGVGLGVTTSKDNESCGTGTTNCDDPVQYAGISGGFGFRILAGLPISVATKKHFNVVLAPEIAFARGSATLFGTTSNMNEPTEADVDLVGMHIDLGARFGGEIQFGFWGLPNLSIQASIGLNFRYSSMTAANGVAGDDADAIADPGRPNPLGLETNGWSIRTLVDDLLNGSVRIIYYL